MIRFLSLGAGVQSSTLALMMAHGEIELQGDPIRGISDEPCGCDETWEE